jgi:hypothetical protein
VWQKGATDRPHTHTHTNRRDSLDGNSGRAFLILVFSRSAYRPVSTVI